MGSDLQHPRKTWGRLDGQIKREHESLPQATSLAMKSGPCETLFLNCIVNSKPLLSLIVIFWVLL